MKTLSYMQNRFLDTCGYIINVDRVANSSEVLISTVKRYIGSPLFQTVAEPVVI